ncbi:MAG: DUF2184 domain-containing protein [Desulfurellales bacterium]|nr:MAG: DUF2184 domain-containing protein [Desulfurellales bacterium]
MQTRLDSAQLSYFNQRLGEVKAGVLEQRYEALRGRQIVPTSTLQIDPLMSSVSFDIVDSQASEPTLISHGDYGKPSEVSMSASQDNFQFKGWALSYSYGYDEIAMAQKYGLPLDATRANAVRRKLEAQIDDICATGNSQTNLKGLYNQDTSGTGIVLTTTAASYGTLAAAGGMTAAEVADDVTRWVLGVVEASKDTLSRGRLVIPAANYRLMQVSYVTRGSSALTVLEDIAKQCGDVIESIVPWAKGQGVGASSRNRMAFFSTADNAVALWQSREITQTDAIDVPDQMRQKVIMHHKTAGVRVLEGPMLAYRDILAP